MKLKNKKGVELTYGQAMSTHELDKEIESYIKDKYPEDYNPGISRFHGGGKVGMTGKQGHGLNVTNVMAIAKFAKKNKDRELIKLIDKWVDVARENDLIESLNEELPTKEIDPNKFPNPGTKNDPGFFKRGKKDGGKAGDDVVATKKVGIPAKSLKPSQDAVYLGKALGLAINGVSGGDLKAIISKDNRILDGHHRWAATMFTNPSAKVGGSKADLGIGDLVPVLRQAGDAMGNERGTMPKGGDVNIFNATMKDVTDAIYQGVNMNPQFYDKEKSIAWFEKNKDKVEKGLKMIQRVGPPDGAPPRQEMPKIEPEQVDKVAKALSGGKIDVRAPYAKNEGIIKPFDTFLNENYFVNERKNFDPPVRRDESELKKMGAEWYFKVPFNEFKSRALGKPNFVTSDNVSPIDADIWWTKQAFSHDGSAHAKILKMLDKYKGDYKGAGDNWEKYKSWIENAMMGQGNMIDLR